MAKGVPLTAALGVELDFIVVTVGIQWRTNKGHYFVYETFATEAGCLDSANWPVKRNGNALLELLVRLLDNIWGEQVDGAKDILLAVFVKNAPSTA